MADNLGHTQAVIKKTHNMTADLCPRHYHLLSSVSLCRVSSAGTSSEKYLWSSCVPASRWEADTIYVVWSHLVCLCGTKREYCTIKFRFSLGGRIDRPTIVSTYIFTPHMHCQTLLSRLYPSPILLTLKSLRFPFLHLILFAHLIHSILHPHS